MSDSSPTLPDPAPAPENVPPPAAEPVASPAPPAEERPIRRLRIGTNVSLQIVIAVILFGVVNYLGYRHFRQWDYTIDRHFTLAPSTQKYLERIKVPLRITVLAVRGETVEQDITPLLDQYRKTLKNRLDIDYVDTRRDVPAWERLKQHLREIGMEIPGNGMLVEQISAPDQKGRRSVRARFIPEEGLYLVGKDDRNQPTRLAFKGETMLNAAIRLVADNDAQRIGVISDFGRPRIIGRDQPNVLHKLKEIGELQNFVWEPVPLFAEETDPLENYPALIWIAPDDFGPSGHEEARMTKYIETPGKALLVMFDPQKSTPRLTAWLAKYGIERQDDKVLYTMQTAAGMDARFDVQARCMDGSLITQGLENQQVQLHILSCSLKMPPAGEKQRAENIEVKPLLAVNDTYWGETSPLAQRPELDKSQDNVPPLFLAVSAERGAARDPAMRDRSSRIVAIGNSTFADPDGIGFASNYDFVVRTINWLLHRDTVTTNDAATDKAKKRFNLDIKPGQAWRTVLICAGILPLLVLAVGLYVWSTRRN